MPLSLEALLESRGIKLDRSNARTAVNAAERVQSQMGTAQLPIHDRNLVEQQEAATVDAVRKAIGSDPTRQDGAVVPTTSVGYAPPTTQVGDPGFANTLMQAWLQRKKMQREQEDSAGMPGQGASSEPYPDLFRWSPQATPHPGAPGVSGVGANPIRRPGTVAQSGPGSGGNTTFFDNGPSLPPSRRFDVELINDALKNVILQPGQQTGLDLSDPSKLFIPGITHPNIPAHFGMKRQRAPGNMDRRWVEDRSPTTLGANVRYPTQRQAWWNTTGNAFDHGDEHARRTNDWMQFSPEDRIRMRAANPSQAPVSRYFQMLERFGLTPTFLAEANMLRGLGEI